MKSGIYYILNRATNKIYVGSSVNITSRKNQHFMFLLKQKHQNSYLQKAYNKYGKDNFVFGVLELTTIEVLIEREQHWMDYFQSTNSKYGYNIIPFADRHALSEETKNKISATKKGIAPHPMTEEGKKRNGEKTRLRWGNGEYASAVSQRIGREPWNKGKKASNEAKLNQSKAQIGKKHTEETKIKLSNLRTGKKCSEETKQKISIAHKGKKGTPLTKEQKLHLSLINTGKKHSEESKQKIAKANIGKRLSEETKQKISIAHKKK